MRRLQDSFLHFNVTANPTASWVILQLREACDDFVVVAEERLPATIVSQVR